MAKSTLQKLICNYLRPGYCIGTHLTIRRNNPGIVTLGAGQCSVVAIFAFPDVDTFCHTPYICSLNVITCNFPNKKS